MRAAILGSFWVDCGAYVSHSSGYVVEKYFGSINLIYHSVRQIIIML